MRLLKYPSFENTLTLNAHTSACYAVSLSPSGEYLAAGGGDALISLWDTQEWICTRTLELTGGIIKSVDFSFDGSYVTAGSDDKEEKKAKQIGSKGNVGKDIDRRNKKLMQKRKMMGVR